MGNALGSLALPLLFPLVLWKQRWRLLLDGDKDRERELEREPRGVEGAE